MVLRQGTPMARPNLKPFLWRLLSESHRRKSEPCSACVQQGQWKKTPVDDLTPHNHRGKLHRSSRRKCPVCVRRRLQVWPMEEVWTSTPRIPQLPAHGLKDSGTLEPHVALSSLCCGTLSPVGKRKKDAVLGGETMVWEPDFRSAEEKGCHARNRLYGGGKPDFWTEVFKLDSFKTCGLQLPEFLLQSWRPNQTFLTSVFMEGDHPSAWGPDGWSLTYDRNGIRHSLGPIFVSFLAKGIPAQCLNFDHGTVGDAATILTVKNGRKSPFSQLDSRQQGDGGSGPIQYTEKTPSPELKVEASWLGNSGSSTPPTLKLLRLRSSALQHRRNSNSKSASLPPTIWVLILPTSVERKAESTWSLVRFKLPNCSQSAERFTESAYLPASWVLILPTSGGWKAESGEILEPGEIRTAKLQAAGRQQK
ncbi:hypothetical protein L345_09375, partial [Ophiophagus hannah]